MNPNIPIPVDRAALLEQLQTKPGCFDCHTHTNVSDGHETPAGLCYKAAALGISHLGITDHDQPMHPKKAQDLSLRYGLDVIPGTELNAVHKIRDKTVLVHLGLLWLPPDDRELNQLLLQNQEQPMERYGKAMLQKLLDLGIDPSGQGVERSYQMMAERNPYCKYLGKGTLADLLVETGYVPSRAEASERYLGEHGQRLAYVAKETLFDYVTMEQVLTTIQRLNRERDTATLVTLNHPFHYRLDPQDTEQLIYDFSGMGHAIEVFYPKHSPERVAYLQDRCETYGLLQNVGSDYHYDAHQLAMGDPHLFDLLLQFHRKELPLKGKNWW